MASLKGHAAQIADPLAWLDSLARAESLQVLAAFAACVALAALCCSERPSFFWLSSLKPLSINQALTERACSGRCSASSSCLSSSWPCASKPLTKPEFRILASVKLMLIYRRL